jgi:hypothetical protein
MQVQFVLNGTREHGKAFSDKVFTYWSRQNYRLPFDESSKGYKLLLVDWFYTLSIDRIRAKKTLSLPLWLEHLDLCDKPLAHINNWLLEYYGIAEQDNLLTVKHSSEGQEIIVTIELTVKGLESNLVQGWFVDLVDYLAVEYPEAKATINEQLDVLLSPPLVLYTFDKLDEIMPLLGGITRPESNEQADGEIEASDLATRPESNAQTKELQVKRQARLNRIIEDYIPKGLTQEQIAELEGVSVDMIKKDYAAMRERGLWPKK